MDPKRLHMDYAELHQGVSLPCVRVRTPNSGGSGTVIYSNPDPEGEHSTFVLTNHHVVSKLITVEDKWDPILQRNAKRDVRGLAEVHFFEYRWASRAIGTTAVEAEIVAYDEDEDLALLKLRSGRSVPSVARLYPKGEEERLRVGMDLYCVGAGLGEPPVITGGYLAQFGREIDHKEFWISTAPGIFGNSGGAVFLQETHEVVGVPARMAVRGFLGLSDAVTHLMYVVPITRVYDFLDNQFLRFIYSEAFTEEGEKKKREQAREFDRKVMAADEQVEAGE